MLRVTFVSKPLGPPYHDGSKCLVRDLATQLVRSGDVAATVMVTRGTGPDEALPPVVRRVPVYAGPGGFAPGLAENARAAAWLLRSRGAHLWHFVFGPNRRTGQVAGVLSALRGVPVVQTVASPPREFAHPRELFFGDAVVAQSTWTRRCIDRALADAGCSRLVLTIPPPAPAVALPSQERIESARSLLQLDRHQRVFLYPGDLEAGSSAEVLASTLEPLCERIGEHAVLVFACRPKTPRASVIERSLRTRLRRSKVRFVGQVEDPLALWASAEVVLFPVDELHGKVDLPISLLEAMALGVPVVAWKLGPLSDLTGAELVRVEAGGAVQPDAIRALVDAVAGVARGAPRRHAAIERQRVQLATQFGAEAVGSAYRDVYRSLLAR